MPATRTISASRSRAIPLCVVAYDGVPVPRMQRMASLVIAPGQRVDLLVQAGGVGTYPLQAIANDQGYPSPTGPLARLVVAGEALAMPLPTALPPAPLAAIADKELSNKRRLTRSVEQHEFPPAANYQEFAYLICGRRFDPDRVDQRVRLSAVEEWSVVNQHDNDHIFHIHTNPFELTAVNGEPLAESVWRDTVVVPANGSVTFRRAFSISPAASSCTAT
jgi:FtsP/CotA-like multicopper oxidase with cupredoxin domain